jgi:hypothetical protein
LLNDRSVKAQSITPKLVTHTGHSRGFNVVAAAVVVAAVVVVVGAVVVVVGVVVVSVVVVVAASVVVVSDAVVVAGESQQHLTSGQIPSYSIVSPAAQFPS